MNNLVPGLASIVVILGCVAYHHTKGSFVKAFVMVISVICASILAFGYFEALGNKLTVLSINNDYPRLALSMRPCCFLLIFLTAVSILQAAGAQLTKDMADFDGLVEKVGKIICGAWVGLMLAGVLLTAFVIAPLSSKYPYQRFEDRQPDPENPSKVLLNADGFVTGWFRMVSGGCFFWEKSFGVFHPDFIGESFLNRLAPRGSVSVFSYRPVLEIPQKKAVWLADDELESVADSNEVIKGKVTIVSIGINRTILKDKGTFTLSQLRLICKPSESIGENKFTGKGKNIYPIGYLKSKEQIELKKLKDIIELKQDDFGEDQIKWFDLAFHVPVDMTPTLIAFRQNEIASLPSSKKTTVVDIVE